MHYCIMHAVTRSFHMHVIQISTCVSIQNSNTFQNAHRKFGREKLNFGFVWEASHTTVLISINYILRNDDVLSAPRKYCELMVKTTNFCQYRLIKAD